MNFKRLLFIGALAMFIGLAGSAAAQDATKNHRQKRLERKQTVNSNKQERIQERNPKGIGLHDNRVDRRGDRIARKKGRTDKRVNRRNG